ncbi:MAG: AMP-binding protein, partial [Bacteroidales bacterium]
MFKVNGKICKTLKEVAEIAPYEVAEFLEEWYSSGDYVTAFTSGSTGAPKKINLLKSDMESSARITNRFFNITESSKLLLCLSPNYIAGKMMIVRWLLSGAEIIADNPTSNPLLNIEIEIDFAAMVPSQVINILDSPITAKRLRLIKYLIIGGSPLDLGTELKLKEIKTACYATYGMTETLSHVALRHINYDNEYFAVGDITFSLDNRGCLVIDVPHLSV